MKPHAARPNPPEPTGPASFPDGTDFRARPPLTQPSRASPRSRDTRLTRGGFPPSRVATGHTTRKMRSRSNPPSGSKGRVCSLEPHFRVKLKPCTFPLKSLVLPSPTPTDGSRRAPPHPSRPPRCFVWLCHPDSAARVTSQHPGGHVPLSSKSLTLPQCPQDTFQAPHAKGPGTEPCTGTSLAAHHAAAPPDT